MNLRCITKEVHSPERCYKRGAYMDGIVRS